MNENKELTGQDKETSYNQMKRAMDKREDVVNALLRLARYREGDKLISGDPLEEINYHEELSAVEIRFTIKYKREAEL